MADMKTFSDKEKCDYYKNRVNDKSLSDRQRNHAQKRLNELCGGKAVPTSPKSIKSSHTVEERAAWGAGVAWAVAKQGKQVKCKPGNEESFRAGVKAARNNPNRFVR